MNQSCFQFGRHNFGFTSKKEVYENLYLQAIIDSYQDIDKSTGLENEIRDRIAWDLQNKNHLTSQLFQQEILDIIPERIHLLDNTEKSRADICFHWSEFGKFEIECKRLFQQPSRNKLYLNDGLIRFIELKYAQNNEYAGMMGFIISGDIDKIQNEITEETKNFHPADLKQQESQLNWKNSFISHHRKINDSDIQIYHLFFVFTEQKL